MSNRHSISTSQRPHAAQGVTLIELMISMALGLLLVATIGYAYVGAKASFRTQNALSRIQEGARYAFEFMGEDIRLAGYTGGPSSYNKIFQTAGWEKKLYDLKQYPLYGYENNGPAWAVPTSGDALTVVHADTENEFNLAAQAAASVTLASGDADVNDYMVVADYSNAAADQVSAKAGAILTFGTGLGGSFTGDLTSRKAYILRGVTYYVANNPAGEPALYRCRKEAAGVCTLAEELIEGVSDMQITYGVDTGNPADGNVDDYWTASQVSAGTDGVAVMPNEAATYGGTAEIGYWRRVLSVRVVLSMISRQGSAAVDSADGRLRKTVTMTIAVRNRLQ